MEISKEPEYCFHKVYLYMPGADRKTSGIPYGTAEIEVYGNRGKLRCCTRDFLLTGSGPYPESEFSVLLFNETGGETLNIGRLHFDQTGCGECNWDFKTSSLTADEIEKSAMIYKLMVKAESKKTDGSPKGLGGVLLEGLFALPFEARDSRVVGFKKEVKVKPANSKVWKNPVFQRVEPFEPPIPNSIWWRIGIQPDFGGGWVTGFCPRQKKYGAGF